MEYYSHYVKRMISVLSLFLLAGSVFLFLVGFPEFLSGWILGSLGNIGYFILLALRVKGLEKMSTIQAERAIKKSMVARFSVIFVIMLIAISVKSISTLATVIGLIALVPAMFVEHFFTKWRWEKNI